MRKTKRAVLLYMCLLLACGGCAQLEELAEPVTQAILENLPDLEQTPTEQTPQQSQPAAQPSFAPQIAALAANPDWQRLYTDFIMENMPMLLSEDESVNVYLPGLCLGLADLDMNDMPELLSIRGVGNAYGDADLEVYTIKGNSVTPAGNYRYTNNEDFYGDGVSFTAAVPAGIHAYKNTKTDAAVFLLLSSWGASSGFGQAVTIFEGGALEGKLRFNFEGDNGEYALTGYEARIDDRNYRFYDGEEMITEAKYQQGLNGLLEEHALAYGDVAWLRYVPDKNSDGPFDYALRKAISEGDTAKLRETVQACFSAYTSPFTAQQNKPEELTVREKDAIAAIACCMSGLPEFADVADLSKAELMQVLFAYFWYMPDHPQMKSVEFSYEDWYFTFTPEVADSIIYNLLGVHIPDPAGAFFVDEYGYAFCRDGVYYVEMSDFNTWPEMVTYEAAGNVYTVSLALIYDGSEDEEAQWRADPAMTLELARSDTPLGFRVLRRIK
ncbi:MAG: hypothetical protein Q4E65_10365 [Clostridia bacterium]|nr:hypothetical protein [Clostridia bacterium]